MTVVPDTIFNYSTLKGKIKEVCGTQDEFSKQMGMSTTSLSLKLNNKIQFTQKEISKACDVLQIPADLISAYFFTQ